MINAFCARKARNEGPLTEKSNSAILAGTVCSFDSDHLLYADRLRRKLQFDGFVAASVSNTRPFAFSFKHSAIDCNSAAEPDGHGTSDGHLHRCGQWNRTIDVSVERERKSNQWANSSSYTTRPTAGSDNGDQFTVVITNSAGKVASNAASLTVNSGSSPTIPQFSHVFIVVEENHSFSDVIGNANMPYLNSLASSNSLATQYYADAHPSLPNYFELTVGEGTSITGTSGDAYSGVVTQDNVVRALTAAGKTWKSYAESLPSAGYLGGDNGAYLQHHNPAVYFSDVQQNSLQAGNVVPFSQLTMDIANDALPNYGFIVPNVNDDAHNCPAGMTTCTDTQKLAAADQWLSANIAPLLASSAFQNSLLIIVFDEAEDSDTAHGGGLVAAILVSPLVHSGYQSTTLYQHESTLRLMMEALGVTDLPGAAATAPDMTEFFP